MPEERFIQAQSSRAYEKEVSPDHPTSAMASSSDFSNGEAAVRRQNRGAPIKFLIPLIYAPVLPLIRIGLRKNPVLRDRLFTAVLAGGFLHGFYLVTDLYDVESK